MPKRADMATCPTERLPKSSRASEVLRSREMLKEIIFLVEEASEGRKN